MLYKQANPLSGPSPVKSGQCIDMTSFSSVRSPECPCIGLLRCNTDWSDRATSQGMYMRLIVFLGLPLLDRCKLSTHHCTQPFVVSQAVYAPCSQRLNMAPPLGRAKSKYITNSRSRVSLIQLHRECVVVEPDSCFVRWVCRGLVH